MKSCDLKPSGSDLKEFVAWDGCNFASKVAVLVTDADELSLIS